MDKVQSNMYNTISLLLEFIMPKFIDRTGQRFGRLIALEHVGSNACQKVIWRCICDCGKETFLPSGDLSSGNTVSCGCYHKERITKHGGWKCASYNSWRAMLRRCNKPVDKDYKNYGALGVAVCPEWLDYRVFAADMGEPEGAQTLDRIDTYGDYTKANCRWASATLQARNKRKRTSLSGVTGVIQTYYGKWMASVTVNKKKYYSPVFSTIEEAAAARKKLEMLHWGVSNEQNH
jgi:hypothetical protein